MLVDIQNLSIRFPTPQGETEAVRGVSLSLGQEKLGIVGESGSGKSLTARSILKLLPGNARIRADRLAFDGMDVLAASEANMRAIRGRRAGLILQDPKYALNPVMTAGSQIAEAWRAHRPKGTKASRREAMEAAVDLLAQVQIRDPSRVAQAYPHELSGGMGQRVMIAMMLAPSPALLIADEPTSALDVSVQAEVLNLLADLQQARGLTYVMVTHNLAVVAHLCARVGVMQGGELVEEISADDLRAGNVRHPHTAQLRSLTLALEEPDLS